MAEGKSPPRVECPQCGQSMDRWPTLDSSGYLLTCNECGFEQSQRSDPETTSRKVEPASHTKETSTDPQRLHQLMAQSDQPGEWPDELLEGLPEETLQHLKSAQRKDKSPLPSNLEKRVRAYGYLLDDDGSGARLSGGGPKPGTGDLSPLDVVRLAAELEGGLPSKAEQLVCPSCQATLPPASESCQWCGHKFPTQSANAGE